MNEGMNECIFMEINVNDSGATPEFCFRKLNLKKKSYPIRQHFHNLGREKKNDLKRPLKSQYVMKFVIIMMVKSEVVLDFNNFEIVNIFETFGLK